MTTEQMLRPTSAVVPIVQIRPNGECEEFLGTGFILAPDGVLVTARHVLAGRPSEPGHTIDIVLRGDALTDPDVSVRRVVSVRLSATRDVAIAELSDTTGLGRLRLGVGRVPTNADILTFEYSHTRVTTENGHRAVRFFPATLKGNAVRHYRSDFGYTSGMRCFDTSFPALGGASGAPVLLDSDFAVVGMLVANVERHLLPAQVVRIEDGPTISEETKYYMPFGQALMVDEVAEACSELQVRVERAEPAA